METICNGLRRRIEDGKVIRLRIDLNRKSVSVNYKTIIKDGKPTAETDLPLHDYFTDSTTLQDVLTEIERRYNRYRHSVPSAVDDRVRYQFQALPYSELTAEDQAFGMGRTVARFDLEYYILCAMIDHRLIWDERRIDMRGKSWFWTPRKGSGLTLSRKWFENLNEN